VRLCGRGNGDSLLLCENFVGLRVAFVEILKQFWVAVDTALDIFGSSAISRRCGIARCHFGWVFFVY
jgi:hypothetical protein